MLVSRTRQREREKERKREREKERKREREKERIFQTAGFFRRLTTWGSAPSTVTLFFF